MIPFENKLDPDSEIYKMVTTNLDDIVKIKAEKELEAKGLSAQAQEADEYESDTFDDTEASSIFDDEEEFFKEKPTEHLVAVEVPTDLTKNSSSDSEKISDTNDNDDTDWDDHYFQE